MADCAVRRTKIPRQLSTSTMTRFAASLRQTIPMAARPPCHTATLRFLRALPHLAKSPLANTSRAHLSWTASVTWSAPRSPATRIAQAVTEPTRAMTASAMSSPYPILTAPRATRRTALPSILTTRWVALHKSPTPTARLCSQPTPAALHKFRTKVMARARHAYFSKRHPRPPHLRLRSRVRSFRRSRRSSFTFSDRPGWNASRLRPGHCRERLPHHLPVRRPRQPHASQSGYHGAPHLLL